MDNMQQDAKRCKFMQRVTTSKLANMKHGMSLSKLKDSKPKLPWPKLTWLKLPWPESRKPAESSRQQDTAIRRPLVVVTMVIIDGSNTLSFTGIHLILYQVSSPRSLRTHSETWKWLCAKLRSPLCGDELTQCLVLLESFASCEILSFCLKCCNNWLV